MNRMIAMILIVLILATAIVLERKLKKLARQLAAQRRRGVVRIRRSSAS